MGVSITFDDSLWPLLISRFRGAATDSEYEEYLSQGTAYLQRGELYVSVLDMGRLVVPTTAQRQRQAEWLQEHDPLLREQFLGAALVLTSPVLRLALSAVLHLKPMPMPYVTVYDVPRGLTWAITRLDEAGLTRSADRIRRHFGLLPGSRSR